MSRITGFSNLKELMQPVADYTTPITPTDTVEACLLKLLSEGRPRSISDIILDLEETQASIDMTSIRTELDILVAKDKVTKFKSESSMILFMLKGASNVANMDIIDNWIFEYMSDRKKHTLEEIADEAFVSGFNRSTIKDRVMILAKKDWFDRSNNGGAALTYKLKVSTKRPTMLMPNNIASNDDAIISVGVASKTIEARKAMTNLETPNTLPKQKATAALLTPVGSFVIDRMGDTKPMMIWKVMADYKPYTANEINILLEGYGFGSSTVSVHLAYLNKLGWFTKNKSAFTLKKTVPMPDASFSIWASARKKGIIVDEKKSTKVIAVECAQPATVNEESTISVTVETFSEALKEAKEKCDAIVQTASEVDDEEPPELITINLKGVEFSLTELATLIEQIKEVKDTFTKSSEDSLLQIERVITVKGVKFTEINILALYSKVMGFCRIVS